MMGPSALTRDWDLFADWCASVGADAVPAGRSVVEAFLTELPGAPSTQLRRVRAIRAGLEAAGYQLDVPKKPVSTTVREGDGWAGARRALAQLPTAGFPVGFRGRRDGWLLVLIAELGFTRRQALAVTTDDVQLFPEITVAGRPVPRADAAPECPACAVTRWLRALGPAANGWRSEVAELLDPRGIDVDDHDCGAGLDGLWRGADVMTPAIDKRGWVSAGQPLSLVSASTIMSARQRLAGLPARRSTRVEYTGRFKDATSAELADAQDDIDARVAALFARSAEILGDTEDLFTHISGFGLSGEDD